MKTPHASSGILEINYKSPLCLTEISPNKLKNDPRLITKAENLPCLIVEFKIKCFAVLQPRAGSSYSIGFIQLTQRPYL